MNKPLPDPDEEYLTIVEVARLLRISRQTATKLFEKEKGVIDLGSAEELHKRGYKILRVSRRVFELVVRKRSIK